MRGRSAAEYLLPGLVADGRGIRGSQIGQAFSDRCEEVLPGRKLSMHGLRKAFAHALAEAEVPGDTRDALMGHAGPSIRSLYAGRAGVVRLEAAVGQLDAAPVAALLARVAGMLA